MRSFIEVLESRIAPASIVNVAYTAATGKLDITAGDAVGVVAAHDVHVFATGANSFRVEARTDTSLNDASIGAMGAFAIDYFGKLTDVSYVGGDGADILQINNFKAIKTLSFNGMDDVDTLDVRDVTTTGDVTVKFGAQTTGTDRSGAFFSGLSTVIGGNVIVDCGNGGGFVDFNAITNTVKGGLNLTGGFGADELYIESHTATIAKGINFVGGLGDDYVSFDGGPSITIGKSATGTALFFDGGDGDEELSIYGDGLVTFQGKVQFDGGAGATNGNKLTVRADALTIMGDLIHNGGADDDELDIGTFALKITGDWKTNLGLGENIFDSYAVTMTVGKTLSYQGGSVGDDFTLNGTSLTILKGLDLALGDGANTVAISPRILKITSATPLLPALKLVGGVNVDDIDVSPNALTVTGLTSIDLGAGDNLLTITPLSGTFTKDVLITGGADGDEIEIGRDLAAFKGSLTVNMGAGTNHLDFHADFTTIAKDLKITGLDGNDRVHPDTGFLTVTGATEINLGDGMNEVDGFLTGATFKKTLTYIGGTGTDDFHLNGTTLTITGAADFQLGGNVNVVELGSAIVTLKDVLKVTGGDDGNTLDLGDRILSIAKATTANFGGGGNQITVSAAQSSFGALSVTTTGGSDNIGFNATKLSAGGLVKLDLGAGGDSVFINTSALALKAGLTILGGDDADGVNVYADGTITGDVLIDLGAASDADQSIYVTGNSGFPGILKVTGALTLSSAATANWMGDNKDFINVYDVTVTKAISVTTGAVDSAIYFNNANTNSTLTIVSGAGKDDVQLETFSTFGAMTVAKATSISLGDDADALIIGFGDSANIVRFLGALTIDGGAGTDTVSDLTLNYFAPGLPAPVLTLVP